jgi:hypothetical protein
VILLWTRLLCKYLTYKIVFSAFYQMPCLTGSRQTHTQTQSLKIDPYKIEKKFLLSPYKHKSHARITWAQKHGFNPILCRSKYTASLSLKSAQPPPYTVQYVSKHHIPFHHLLSVWHLTWPMTISASWGVEVEPIPTTAKKARSSYFVLVLWLWFFV